MKKAMVAMAVAVSLAFTSGVALASSCPKVIKQGRDAAATMKADDPKVKGAVAKLEETPDNVHRDIALANRLAHEVLGRSLDELPPQTHGNAVAEVVWTVVPTLIVVILFVASWSTLNTVEATSPQPEMKVRAVAAQFLWSFDYLPDDYDPVTNKDAKPLLSITTPEGPDGGLTLPVGRSVHLYLQSPDVIHAFYVPQFLFKRDVVPGRTNSFEFTINEKDVGGTFHGQCAELCGAGHNQMHFDVHTMEGAAFDTWLEQKIAQAAASPSPPPQPSGGSAPPGQPGAAPIAIAAHDIAFDTAELSAPADMPFQIEFDNQDPSIPHNVAIHEGSPQGPEVFRGEIFPGPAKKTYDVPPLAAGTYGFICSVHPTTMTGTLTVQ